MMDLPTAKAPTDTERQRAELALMAAAPLQGNRKGKTCRQHDASALDLFRAVDEPSLFDTPAAQPVADTFDYDAHEAERVERHKRQLAEWDVERERMGAAVEAGIAAGREERVQWGSGRFGKAPYWTLRLVEHEGEVFAHEEMELHNSGSFGGWRSYGKTTIEAVKIERARNRINDAGCDLALGYEPTRDAQQRKLANWIIEQFPPLLSGVDFAAELDAAITLYTARNKLRCVAIHAGEREYADERGRTLTIYSLGRIDHD